MSDIEELQARLCAFRDARDWDQFHTPKNLAMALAGEVGELVAEFQWLTPQESTHVMADDDAAAAIRSEVADVMIYLAMLADRLDIDLVKTAITKVDRNERRFPEPGLEPNTTHDEFCALQPSPITSVEEGLPVHTVSDGSKLDQSSRKR